jgi:molybdopterin-binding protein
MRVACPLPFRTCGDSVVFMPNLRVGEVAELLGVSDDTIRRLIAAGTLSAISDPSGRTTLDGAEVARYARERSEAAEGGNRVSARNRIRGIVTDVRLDAVMAQVDLVAGPFRVTSLMSRDAAVEMGLEPGVPATFVVKATTAIVERESS